MYVIGKPIWPACAPLILKSYRRHWRRKSRKSCVSAWLRDKLQPKFLGELQSAATYRLDGSRLELRRADGALAGRASELGDYTPSVTRHTLHQNEMPPNELERPLILVTGATGYIGGRLVPRLLELGYRVRCLVRDAARLQGRAWQSEVEIATGDMLYPATLVPAMQGVKVAYYLVHSLGSGADFSERDVSAASNFATAACTGGIERIIYLGGLGEASPELSEHLRSRQQTGDVLRAAAVPVTEFRAGVIVGSGSLSFELIRYLTERVPVMICPRWVYTRTQPIGIREVLEYLTAALDVPESTGRIIEIGGAEINTYGEMMTIYAEVRGLKRWMVSVPFLTPRLSSYWVNLVTPIPAAIARPLIEGLRNENIVQRSHRCASSSHPSSR